MAKKAKKGKKKITVKKPAKASKPAKKKPAKAPKKVLKVVKKIKSKAVEKKKVKPALKIKLKTPVKVVVPVPQKQAVIPASKQTPEKKAPKKVQPALVVPDLPEKPKVIIKQQTFSKKPEPKGKYVLEYQVRSSIPILFEFISTPSGLAEWFADDVNVRQGGLFTFLWDGSQQEAKMIVYRDLEFVRFKWSDKNDGSYFEFRIQVDELTGDMSLVITDFADNSELETNKLVWDSQVDKLLHVIGSFTP
jgi:uncharacterized protein YndB with AHSA1/START domain